jgi:hypothetical protein
MKTYKGYTIERIFPSGYYTVSTPGTMHKLIADTMQGIKKLINNEIKH